MTSWFQSLLLSNAARCAATAGSLVAAAAEVAKRDEATGRRKTEAADENLKASQAAVGLYELNPVYP